MTERGAEIRQKTKDAAERVEAALAKPWVADDTGVPIEAADLRTLLQAVKRGEQFAVAVGQYNGIRISTLEPTLERTELWERNKERYESMYSADLGWIWSALAELTDAYRERQGRSWGELTQKEQDQSESISFLHNWVKLIALQKWDSEEILRDVQADAIIAAAARADQLELDSYTPGPGGGYQWGIHTDWLREEAERVRKGEVQ